MKKSMVLLFLLILTLSLFAASELDSLLTDDENTFSGLLSDENKLEPKSVFVEQITGEAFLQHDDSDKWFQIIEKTAIKEKDTVITMEKSDLKIRMEKDVYINVGEKTKLYFNILRGKPDEEIIVETGLKLVFGKLFSNVRRKIETNGKYEVEAGSIVAGVRGTQYLARLNTIGEINVKVYEGKVYCRFIDEEGNNIKKKKREDTEEVSEVVLNANEEFTILKDAEIEWNITPHNETAPVELEEMNNIPEEL